MGRGIINDLSSVCVYVNWNDCVSYWLYRPAVCYAGLHWPLSDNSHPQETLSRQCVNATYRGILWVTSFTAWRRQWRRRRRVGAPWPRDSRWRHSDVTAASWWRHGGRRERRWRREWRIRTSDVIMTQWSLGRVTAVNSALAAATAADPRATRTGRRLDTDLLSHMYEQRRVNSTYDC